MGVPLNPTRVFKRLMGKEFTVDFLRIGRLNLIYQFLDGSQTGYWDKNEERWVNLPSSYSKSVQKGIRMAKKQIAPDLIKVPLPTPSEVVQ